MKASSRHTVRVEAAIPVYVNVFTHTDVYTDVYQNRSHDERKILVIQATSDESAEAAEQAVLETVERIIQAVRA